MGEGGNAGYLPRRHNHERPENEGLLYEKGFLCGKMLSDFGADVIKVEPPRGDPVRRSSPFYHDMPYPEKSLYWFAYSG